jgi:hypothetical protein
MQHPGRWISLEENFDLVFLGSQSPAVKIYHILKNIRMPILTGSRKKSVWYCVEKGSNKCGKMYSVK